VDPAAASDDKQTLNVFLTTQLVFYLRPQVFSSCVSWCGHDWLGHVLTRNVGFGLQVVSDLLKIFGDGWAKKTVVPKVQAMAVEGPERTYIARLTSLMVIQQCAITMSKEALNKTLLPSVLKLCKDSVPNVRFNASKCLEAIAGRVDKGSAVKDVKPQLEAMLKDTDSDVKFYAQAALAAY
jgi:hypothetical protein